jgi:uncharacterized protein YraI
MNRPAIHANLPSALRENARLDTGDLTMKMKILALLAVALAAPSAAFANIETGFANMRAELRAGPGIDFPRVATIAEGVQMDIDGCIASGQWCEVGMLGMRGWLNATQLDIHINGLRETLASHRTEAALPTITWNLEKYWSDNYRDRTIYQMIDLYRGMKLKGT